MNTKQLRQKILDLAIRGKLVPQDPADEPASVLLERIAAEKAQLVREGKIKADKRAKTYPAPTDRSHYAELPENWAIVHLSDLGQIVGGGTPSTKESEYWNGDIAWITPADLSGYTDKYISYGSRNITKNGLASSSAIIMPAGSVLMSSRAPIGYCVIASNEVCTNQGFKSVVPYITETNGYLYYYLIATVEELRARASGTTFKEISGTEFGNTIILLPPLAEQHRIVAAIESAFAVIDEIEQSKGDLGVAVTSAKSKILSLAVSGKLVPQDEGDEPAAVLLERIKTERAKLIKAGKIKPDKRGKDAVATRDNSHYEKLPKGWAIVRLDGVADVLDSQRKPINATERNERISGKARTELYPYYGATGQVGYIDDYIFDGKYILLGEDGAPFLDRNADKAYIINGKVWVNNHAHILEAKIDTNFLCHALNAVNYDGYVNGTTRLKLTQADMKGIVIAVPPLAEQKRIADTIAALYRILDEIMSNIA